MPGTLKIDPELSRQVIGRGEGGTITFESPEAQVARIMVHLRKELADDPDKKIALIYAANDRQANSFHDAYRSSLTQLPQVSGSGQAELFQKLIDEINKDPSLNGKIRVLPVATSLSGGKNGPGNIVSKEMIQRDLSAIQKHIQDGYDVRGIAKRSYDVQRIQSSDGYAIGGDTSEHWFTQDHAAIQYNGQLYSQGDFVQLQLEALEKDPHLDLDEIFNKAELLTGEQLKEEQLKEAKMGVQARSPVSSPPVSVTTETHNLGDRKKDWEDIISNYNKKYEKEVPQTSNKLVFKSLKDATDFMKEQASDKKRFMAQLVNADGTKRDHYMYSRGDGTFYEGSAANITAQLRKELTDTLMKNPPLDQKIEAVKEVLKFEGMVSKTSLEYKDLDGKLKKLEQQLQEQQNKSSTLDVSSDDDTKEDQVSSSLKQ